MKFQRGDTIVEVMFSMVVISLSLGIAFGTANKSLQTTRATQERTEAQKIAESQIELLKIKFNSDEKIQITSLDGSYCVYKDSASTGGIGIDSSTSGPKCRGVKQLGSEAEYSVEVKNTKVAGKFTQFNVTVNWVRLGANSTELEKLKLFYRPGSVSTTQGAPIYGSAGLKLSSQLNRITDSNSNSNSNIRFRA